MSRRKYFAVTGKGNFPFIMLSLDECYPASQDEADKIAYACPTQAPELSIVFATLKDGAPNGRWWKERGWLVTHVSN